MLHCGEGAAADPNRPDAPLRRDSERPRWVVLIKGAGVDQECSTPALLIRLELIYTTDKRGLSGLQFLPELIDHRALDHKA